MSLGKEREHNLQAGDNVEVCEGELINLQGKILSVDGNKITIMPKHEDLKVHACTLFHLRWPPARFALHKTSCVFIIFPISIHFLLDLLYIF